MTTLLYSFPQLSTTADDPIIGLLDAANAKFPGFITVVIDGGAGVGSFTDRVLRASTTCHVTAFEPLPENAAVLRTRFGKSASVDIRELALGDRSACVSFEVPERAGEPGSFWVPGTSYGGWVSKTGIVHTWLPLLKRAVKKMLGRNSSTQYETVSVRMVRLDAELIRPPDLIKFDLQGGEPEALDGLGEFLRQTKVVKIEVLLRGAMAGQGEARTRCIRALRDAGFSLFVDGFQFAVPEMTDSLRRTLGDLGVQIQREGRLHPSNPEVMVKGSWPNRKPLPIQTYRRMGKVGGLDLTNEFATALSEAKATYFCVDIIALNSRYAQQWRSILPTELLECSEPALSCVAAQS